MIPHLDYYALDWTDEFDLSLYRHGIEAFEQPVRKNGG
jgi:hypothetical protein